MSLTAKQAIDYYGRASNEGALYAKVLRNGIWRECSVQAERI